ncbi:MAG TPA: sensor histidine kinase [Bryobacteraceae bacterium]|nr:sensor histidine kinase [Bryobacteraceae bacterium]
MAPESWLWEAFLQQSPACYWIVDSQGVLHAVHGDAASFFGKAATDVKGHSLDRLFNKQQAAAWVDRLGRALAGETCLFRERRGGSTWNISLFPIRRDERIQYAGALAREVTPWGTAEQELRQTVLSALKAQEFERKMASQFLHDSVGQNMTALGLQLDLVRMDLEGTAPESSARLTEIQKVLEGIMEEVRDYSYELNPSIVERAGLRPALDRLVSRIRSRFAGTVRLIADPTLKIEPKTATGLYHIAQEAVENAVQHAGCSAIEIALKSTRKGPILEIRDNGRGFDPEDVVGVRRGLGLLSMEHYAAQSGLDLSISRNREGGTKVRVEAPGTA